MAVECGYWPLYRYNPLLKKDGKNPFILDSKAPKSSLKEFLSGEIRFASLAKVFPEEADRLQTQLEKEFAERYLMLKQKAEQEPPMVITTPGAAGDDTESDVCTLTSTAEHGGDAPCDDGRAG